VAGTTNRNLRPIERVAVERVDLRFDLTPFADGLPGEALEILLDLVDLELRAGTPIAVCEAADSSDKVREEERHLVSRIEGGLVFFLHSPDVRDMPDQVSVSLASILASGFASEK
jgi:hypothetical protein